MLTEKILPGCQTFKVHVRAVDFCREIEIVPVYEDDQEVRISCPIKGDWEVRAFRRTERIPDDLPVLKMPESWAKMLYEGLAEIFGPKGPAPSEQELKAVENNIWPRIS